MIIQTAYAPIFLEADEQGLTQLHFLLNNEEPLDHTPLNGQKFLQQAEQELQEYFARKRQTFTVPLHFTIGTPFQQKVWKTLTTIPYGTCWSYQEVAQKVGSPKAVRAIGQANFRNPLALIIPCHRVIGKNGKLTGYMGNTPEGLALKSRILRLEGYAH